VSREPSDEEHHSQAAASSSFADLDPQAYVAAIVESSDDAIFSKNAQAIIQTWNRAAERLYGYEATEIVGSTLAVIIPPERAGEERRLLDRVLRGERIDHFEADRVCKGGRRVEVSVSLVPICEASGRIVGAASITRDITEIKRAQRHIMGAAAVSHALGEAHLDEEAMLSVIARQIAAALGDSCALGLVNEDGTVGTISYHHRDPEAVDMVREVVSQSSFSTAEGLLGEVLRTGKVIRVAEADPDVLQGVVHERFGAFLRRYPMYALMLAPISNEGQIFGVVAVMRDTSGRRFDEQDEDFAVDLAARAGLAVANARLYQAARDEVAQRETAEASPRESEERFRRLAEKAPVVIYRYRLGADPGFE